MHADGHVVRPPLDRVIDQVGVDVQQPLHMLAPRLQSGDLFRVAQIGDVHFIKLQVAAAGRRERLHGVVIGVPQIGEEPIELGIYAAVDRSAPAAEMHHRWRGDGLFRHCRSHVACQETVVIDHDGMVVYRIRPFTRSACGNTAPLNWIFCSGS